MTNSISKLVGSRIKAFREERGLTQVQLAQLLGKSMETVSNFERGKVVPGLLTIEKLAQVLKVQVRDFFEESDASPATQDKAMSKNAATVSNAVDLLSEENLEVVAGVIAVLESQQKRKSLKPPKQWRKKR